MADYHMLINGQAASSEESFNVLNPATEEVIASVPKASPAGLDAAVAAARAARPAWAALSMDDRREIILKIADRIEENLPELGSLLSSEQGKPMEGFSGLGAMFEMGGCLAWIRYTASLDLPVEVIQDDDEARIEVHRKPVGVVGSITPELPTAYHVLACYPACWRLPVVAKARVYPLTVPGPASHQ